MPFKCSSPSVCNSQFKIYHRIAAAINAAAQGAAVAAPAVRPARNVHGHSDGVLATAVSGRFFFLIEFELEG